MIESEARPETEFWEPWTPAVGQRVRVRLSGECPLQSSLLSSVLDGEIGVVAEIDRANGGPTSLAGGHYYRVRLERAEDVLPAAWMRETGPWAAAIELDPAEAF